MKMTFSVLEDRLLHEVLSKSQVTSDLLNTYVDKRGVSRAGFYKALASLKRKEVLLVKKGLITVNKIWLANSYDFFRNLVTVKQQPGYLAQQIIKLEPDEELTYAFRSLSDIDIFLINLIYDLLLLSKEKVVLIEEAHEFFLLLNTKRTSSFLNEMQDFGSALYLLSHSSSAIDKELLKNQLALPAQGYATGSDRPLPNIVHVVGDIIIELVPDKAFLTAIGKEYAKSTTIAEGLRDTVTDLTEQKQRHRIRVYRDPALAKSMRTRFRKYFVNL